MVEDYPPSAATQIEEVYDVCAGLEDVTESTPAQIALQHVYATLAVAQAIVELTAVLAGRDPETTQ